jgi:hypothetical protein
MKRLPTSYISRAPNGRLGTSPHFCKAFAEGCGGGTTEDGRLIPGPVALFGSPLLWDQLMQAIAEGRDWYYGDHGYFRRGKCYRVTRNAYQHTGLQEGRIDRSRFEECNVEIEPWQTGGVHILVCPPDQPFSMLHRFNSAAWLGHVLEELSYYTSRPINVRSRSASKSSRLEEDLRGAHALVTYTSNAAVEAVCAGVPVFCTGPCAGSAMGLRDLSQIEKPRRPHMKTRRRWAEVLAANQWTLDEMREGKCWEAIGR